MNNLIKIFLLITKLQYLSFILILLGCLNIQAQDIEYANGKKYTIGDISVAGNTTFSPQTIVTYSGLTKGKEILIPGEEISEAIKKPLKRKR